jgi:hypothetical protein
MPRMKTLEAFEFDRSGVSAGHLRTVAEGERDQGRAGSCWSAMSGVITSCRCRVLPDLEALNALLLWADQARVLDGRKQSIGAF